MDVLSSVALQLQNQSQPQPVTAPNSPSKKINHILSAAKLLKSPEKKQLNQQERAEQNQAFRAKKAKLIQKAMNLGLQDFSMQKGEFFKNGVNLSLISTCQEKPNAYPFVDEQTAVKFMLGSIHSSLIDWEKSLTPDQHKLER